MTYLLSSDGRDEDVVGAFERYRLHLEYHRDSFPASAYALATSNWYFAASDHRCPHDARLTSAALTELSTSRAGPGQISLHVRLLGAYRDGHIELIYPQVFSYRLAAGDCADGHRDWRYDELRLSDAGHVIHEIEWWGPTEVGSWLIEASDVEFRWLPL
ncbi:MAG: hypothetical protein U1E56_06035 [Bauldia sp.]